MRLRSAWLHLAAKAFPAKNSPPLLLKVEITRAFETVSRLFAFNMLPHLGSGRHWRNWVAILLASSKLSHPPQWIPGSKTGRVLQKEDPSVPCALYPGYGTPKCLIPDSWTIQHVPIFWVIWASVTRSVYADDVVVFFTPMKS